MDEETELPVSGEAAASAATEQDLSAAGADQQQGADDQAEGEEKTEEKPAKSPEQREIDRLRKSTARLTRQREEARAQLALTRETMGNRNDDNATGNETVSLTRAELQEIVKQQAEQLAPTLQSQREEFKHKQGVVEGLAKSLGQDRFDELASDLDDVFGGLADSKGNAKPATEAIFYADNPQALIEYLADPDNEDEAEAIAKMGAVQAGRAIAKLEGRLESVKKAGKPKASGAAKPLESVKGGAPKGMPNPVTNEKEWRAWRNAEERAGR